MSEWPRTFETDVVEVRKQFRTSGDRRQQMSQPTSVVLHADHVLSDEVIDALENNGPMNSYGPKSGLRPLDQDYLADNAGGTLAFCSPIWCAEFDAITSKQIVEWLKYLPWQPPDCCTISIFEDGELDSYHCVAWVNTGRFSFLLIPYVPGV